MAVVYACDLPLREAAQTVVDQIGLPLEHRESSFWGGDYYTVPGLVRVHANWSEYDDSDEAIENGAPRSWTIATVESGIVALTAPWSFIRDESFNPG